MAFEKGVKTLNKELDIVRVFKRIRELETYIKVIMEDDQRRVMKLASRKFISKRELLDERKEEVKVCSMVNVPEED